MKTLMLLLMFFCTAASAQSAIDSPFPDQNMGPSVVIPATGGPPVVGIPLGGNIFLPVTGGAPIVGIPTGP